MNESRLLQHARRSARSLRFLPSRAALALARGVSRLNLPLQRRIGTAVGRLAYRAAPRRRRIAAVNLRLCFPEQTRAERRALLRAHFENAGRGAIEIGQAWWAADAVVDRLAHVDGFEHVEAAAMQGRGVILLSAHFTPLALGVRVAQRQLDALGLPLGAMYKAPADPVIDRAIRAHRGARLRGALVPHTRVEAVIAALKRGDAVWYAGDQKAGARLGVAADFFGHPVQTHIALCRIAAMTRAVVVPYFFKREAGECYRAAFHPALAAFPSGDEARDAARINALIEAEVRAAPSQYFWLHRRFRRRGFDPYATCRDREDAQT